MNVEQELEDYQAKLIAAFNEFDIPRYMWEGISDYVLYGRPVGDFLTAVFSNDLFKAVQHADLSNQRALPGYAKMCFNAVPTVALQQGMAYWRKVGGLKGHLEAQQQGQAGEAEHVD